MISYVQYEMCVRPGYRSSDPASTEAALDHVTAPGGAYINPCLHSKPHPPPIPTGALPPPQSSQLREPHNRTIPTSPARTTISTTIVMAMPLVTALQGRAIAVPSRDARRRRVFPVIVVLAGW